MAKREQSQHDSRHDHMYQIDRCQNLSGANALPLKFRLGRSWPTFHEDGSTSSAPNGGRSALANRSSAKGSEFDHVSVVRPLPTSILNNHQPIQAWQQFQSQSITDHQNVNTVTHDIEHIAMAQAITNANGSHPPYRHQQTHPQRDRKSHALDGATTPITSHGPTPSHIQVAKPYVFHQTVEGCLHNLGVAQAREDNIRLAGVTWIDSVRKALKLPVRTFDTAVIYYHKFRLSHADNEYSFVDAAAAALFAACKIEDTLKKSRDILCAAHNINITSRADHLSPDDPMFEQQSRTIIGLERLMLEGSSFDFRNRHPQQLIVKLTRYYGYEKHSAVTKCAHLASLDLYRTFAPLKQSTATMAFACLELAQRLHGQEKEEMVEGKHYSQWGIERAMVMETLLDLLELYTSYRKKTTIGPEFPTDTFLDIRISLNEELSKSRLPRYTEFLATSTLNRKTDPASQTVANTNGAQSKSNGPAVNGRAKTSPTSPATPSTPGIRQKAGERGKEGTVRFMLNPDREREEKRVSVLYAPLMASMRR